MKDDKEAYFVVAGDGTDYCKIKDYCENEKPDNMKLLPELPRDDYDALTGACDVGLIFLNHKSTTPNFQQRILSYMQARIPILASTDTVTDLGDIITENGFGWWCESKDTASFTKTVRQAVTANRAPMGERGYDFLCKNYSTDVSCDIIFKD